MTVFKKDPNARLDYTVDWTLWLAPVSDTIASAVWVPSTGIVVDTPTHTATAATAWASGGVIDEAEYMTCRITTAAGRIDDRTVFFKIAPR